MCYVFAIIILGNRFHLTLPFKINCPKGARIFYEIDKLIKIVCVKKAALIYLYKYIYLHLQDTISHTAI